MFSTLRMLLICVHPSRGEVSAKVFDFGANGTRTAINYPQSYSVHGVAVAPKTSVAKGL